MIKDEVQKQIDEIEYLMQQPGFYATTASQEHL